MNAWPMDTPFNVTDLSLQPPASFPELYQELWWYSGSYLNSVGTNSAYKAAKGQTALVTASSSVVNLYTHSATWPASTKCAFECTLSSQGGSATANAQLYDITAGAVVAGAQISTTSTTATVLRSGQVTLIPGHVYGVSVWTNNASYGSIMTDASLIIFPPAGSVSPSLSSISLANPSGGTLKEAYIPLWAYSSGTVSNGGYLGSGQAFLQKGSTSVATSTSGSATKLYSLGTSWSASQKFALEVSGYGTSGNGYFALWDITSGAIVSTSQITISASTATLTRSSSFTLTPGHSYGITIWATNSSYLTKAHLVALGG